MKQKKNRKVAKKQDKEAQEVLLKEEKKNISPVRKVWNAVKPFVNGGSSGMLATVVIQPVDMVKVRIQLGAQGNPIKIGTNIIKNEGYRTLYTGLGAGLLRQATYTTTRLGIFKIFHDLLEKYNEGKQVPLYQKAFAGLTAGGIGAFVGTPADLALVRMQANGVVPLEQRKNYNGAIQTLVTISKEEGLLGCFTGAGVTIVRACALNLGMLASNEQTKEYLLEKKVPRPLAVGGAAMVAGFFASFFSLPFDFVKTRLQKQSPLASGKMPYKGFTDCAIKTLRQEGPLKFYTGFPTYYMRIAPHVVMTLIFVQIIQDVEKKLKI